MNAPLSMLAPPIVELRHVTRRFGAKTALDDVSLSIPRGGVFGLIGGNGAGKTTIIKHILGLLTPNSGAVKVFGLDPAPNPVGVLGRIGYLSEERDLPGWMRVGELLRYTRAFYPTWDPAFEAELREQFALDLGARVKNLSKGQRARVGLVLALAHRPELLVLDEPSSGLDPIVRREAGDASRDDPDLVPAPDQLRPLSQRLPFGAAGAGVELAEHIADAQGRIGHEELPTPSDRLSTISG